MKAANRAFTLIEVTLGMAIIILIFGVIFQLVQFSVIGADAAAKYSMRNREVSGLFALMRQICLDLPLKSQLGLTPRSGGGYDLALTNAPLAILPDNYIGLRVLELRLTKAGTGDGRVLNLVERLEFTNAAGMGTARGGQTNSFELMRGIQSLTWSVWDPRSQQELGEWLQPVKPSYLKLQLVRKDGARNLTNVGIFWIPTGLSPSGQVPVDPLTLVALGGVLNSTNISTNIPVPVGVR
ncbi:MAG: hypothetical protein NTZ01_08260 [Verrucomicrobia bacterium]|nr:hypothetical protein [Verrucomicrobiota bacterium]